MERQYSLKENQRRLKKRLAQKDLPYKLEAYDYLREYLSKILKSKKPIILAGDFNAPCKKSI